MNGVINIADSVYGDIKHVKNLLRGYWELKVKAYSEGVSADTEEIVVIMMDIDRALKRLTPYDREILYLNCSLRIPASEIGRRHGSNQPNVSRDINLALCKMVTELTGQSE